MYASIIIDYFVEGWSESPQAFPPCCPKLQHVSSLYIVKNCVPLTGTFCLASIRSSAPCSSGADDEWAEATGRMSPASEWLLPTRSRRQGPANSQQPPTADAASSCGSQRPPEPAQPPKRQSMGEKGSGKGKSFKGKSSTGKGKGKQCLDSESESEWSGALIAGGSSPTSPHYPGRFDPVHHHPTTVIFPGDIYRWFGITRDRTWDDDIEAVD